MNSDDLKTWIEGAPEPQCGQKDLSEALYAFSEVWMWPDCVDSVSTEQAILIWKIVQALIDDPFPEHLRV